MIFDNDIEKNDTLKEKTRCGQFISKINQNKLDFEKKNDFEKLS